MTIEQLNELFEAITTHTDGGEQRLRETSVNDNFALIAFLGEQEKQGLAAPGTEGLALRVKTMFVRRLLADGGAFYSFFSGTTKCHQELQGAGMVALDKHAADYIMKEQAEAGYAVILRSGDEKELGNVLRGMIYNGFAEVRFYKSGCAAFEVTLSAIFPEAPAVDGQALRYGMLSFLQEVRRKVPVDKLKDREKAMLSAVGRANLYLPGKTAVGNGQKTVTHPCIRIQKGAMKQTLLPVFTGPEKLAGSEDFKKMKQQDSEWEIIRSGIGNLFRYCEGKSDELDGIIIDMHDCSLILPTSKIAEAILLGNNPV